MEVKGGIFMAHGIDDIDVTYIDRKNVDITPAYKYFQNFLHAVIGYGSSVSNKSRLMHDEGSC